MVASETVLVARRGVHRAGCVGDCACRIASGSPCCLRRRLCLGGGWAMEITTGLYILVSFIVYFHSKTINSAIKDRLLKADILNVFCGF